MSDYKKVKMTVKRVQYATIEIDLEDYSIDEGFKGMYDFVQEVISDPLTVWEENEPNANSYSDQTTVESWEVE